MAAKIRVNMDGVTRFLENQKEAAKAMTLDIEKAVIITTMETRNEVVKKEPVYKGGLINQTQFKAPIRKGRGYIKSISGEVFLVGGSALYGNVQDLGRKQGARMPPSGPIRRWVKLKAGRGEFDLPKAKTRTKAIAKAAFLVARKISKNPAPGIKFFERSMGKASADLYRRVEAVRDKVIRDMTSGG